MRSFVLGLVLAIAVHAAASAQTPAQERPLFDAAEVQRILSHGPWPMPWSPDPSNRVSGKPAAAALGRQLYFDKRLSRFGALSCAFCHDPKKAWGDGRVNASSVARLDRNTTALYNVRNISWFGWDGASDSLWMHSIRSLTDPRELAATPEHAKGLLSGDAKLAAAYAKVFGTRAARDDPEAVLVNAAKALAAFQETIVTGSTPFDDYHDALAKGDKRAMARYPAAAERGLKIFIGKGQCGSCHTGPLFTNGAFHDIGLRKSAGPEAADPDRNGGLIKLKASPYTRLGPHSDDTSGTRAQETRDATDQEAGRKATSGNVGFKVPSLRNVALTAPYMHNGSKATLAEAVRHQAGADLADREISDLVAFLGSLTSRSSNRPQP